MSLVAGPPVAPVGEFQEVSRFSSNFV